MSVYFTEDHEWIKVDGDEGTVGISPYAAKQLGDVVYVELPELGREVGKGDEAAPRSSRGDKTKNEKDDNCMRYLPLNANDRAAMLDVIGVDNIDALFEDVPKAARLDSLIDLPLHQFSAGQGLISIIFLRLWIT